MFDIPHHCSKSPKMLSVTLRKVWVVWNDISFVCEYVPSLSFGTSKKLVSFHSVHMTYFWVCIPQPSDMCTWQQKKSCPRPPQNRKPDLWPETRFKRPGVQITCVFSYMFKNSSNKRIEICLIKDNIQKTGIYLCK